MSRPLATVIEQPRNLFGEPAYAVVIKQLDGRVTVVSMHTDPRAAEAAAAEINPKPRDERAPSPQLALFDF